MSAVIRSISTASDGNVRWGAQIGIVGAGDALAPVWGEAVEVTTNVTHGHLSVSAELADIPMGDAAPGDLALIRVYRDGASAADTLSGSIDLIGATIYYARV